MVLLSGVVSNKIEISAIFGNFEMKSFFSPHYLLIKIRVCSELIVIMSHTLRMHAAQNDVKIQRRVENHGNPKVPYNSGLLSNSLLVVLHGSTYFFTEQNMTRKVRLKYFLIKVLYMLDS